MLITADFSNTMFVKVTKSWKSLVLSYHWNLDQLFQKKFLALQKGHWIIDELLYTLNNFGIFQDVKFFFSVVLDVYATVAFGNKERIFGTWFGWTVNLFRSGPWKYEKFLQNLKILHNPIMCCFQRCLFYIWKLWILLKDFI